MITSIGCGSAAYEQRLENARKYYVFMDEQNSNLAPEWKGPGLSMRLPLQMELLPAPVVEVDEDGNPLPVKNDPRQPGYTKLRGLQAAWKTEIPAQQGKTFPAFFYILSNRELLAVEDEQEAAINFTFNAVADIASSLQVTVPEDVDWLDEQFPKNEVYLRKKLFKTIVFKPGRALLGTAANLRIYRLEQSGTVQTLLVYVVPRGIEEGLNRDPDELMKRITMSLATFWASEHPAGVNSGGSGDSASPF